MVKRTGRAILISENSRRYIAFLLPCILLLTTYLAFHYFTQIFGQKIGYFLAFIFYWTFWCLFIPTSILGWGKLKHLFLFSTAKFRRNNFINTICLLIPLFFAYGYAFPKVLPHANFLIIITSVLLSFANATMEEILWRGLYLKLIPNRNLYVIVSSLGFAVWHFAPQTIFSNKAPGGQISFVFASLILGILYSIASKNLKSILPSTISHILFDFSGLGSRLYFK